MFGAFILHPLTEQGLSLQTYLTSELLHAFDVYKQQAI